MDQCRIRRERVVDLYARNSYRHPLIVQEKVAMRSSCFRSLFSVLSCVFACSLFGAAEPSIVSVEQLSDRTVEITYLLEEASAVVTLRVQTNNSENVWIDIPGAMLRSLSGDVNRLVEAGGRAKVVRWRPGSEEFVSEMNLSNMRFVVTAWPVDDPPPYMVVSLAKKSDPRARYYPSADSLPGGLLTRNCYRTDMLVMRKIPAKNVTWIMGAKGESGWMDGVGAEKPHQVTLAANYYIGVFPVTQRQWANVAGDAHHAWHDGTGRNSLRAMEYCSFYELRESAISEYAAGKTGGSSNGNCRYPNAPSPNSFLGLLRARTGIDFDLPSEAQWEYACRAGHGYGFYGDGSAIGAANLARIACFGRGASSDPAVDPASGGTPIVGSSEPNDFGIYDMNGCVWEYCIDYFASDITGETMADGGPNANGGYLVSDPSKTGWQHIRRGGGYDSDAGSCRPAFRYNNIDPNARASNTGVRVVCPAIAH
jgi:formylglycine-generating enzyme required for sulfatase activity